MTRDPYDVLGVSRSASHEEIRAAYRTLAKKYHPDRNPGDAKSEDLFKQASAAFDVIGDEETRKKFDNGLIDADGRERAQPFWGQSGGAGQRPGGGQTFRWETTGGGDFGGAEDIGDILHGIFGQGFGQGPGQGPNQGFGRARPGGQAGARSPFEGAPFEAKGKDIQYSLTIDFLEMANGATKRIELSDGGKLDVKIPAGIESGQTLRLKGKGMTGLGGGQAGDALVVVSVRNHPFYERDGKNIRIELPITLKEAVLGAKVNVPTISGKVAVTVPKGSSSGRMLRLKNKGIYDQKSGIRGDQFIKLMITLPDEVDPELEKFFEKHPETADFNPRKYFDQ